jgi:hypothetical protein
MKHEFGLTNSQADIDAVHAFREAAKADGWTCEPTYASEPEESAARLSREGFTMQLLSRANKPPNRYGFQAQVNIWGPDGLAINPPEVYDWQKIKAGLTTCSNCGKTDVPTQRYSFAGRACEACLPEMRAKHERGNWTA